MWEEGWTAATFEDMTTWYTLPRWEIPMLGNWRNWPGRLWHLRITILFEV